jgi:hypothetical protein
MLIARMGPMLGVFAMAVPAALAQPPSATGQSAEPKSAEPKSAEPKSAQPYPSSPYPHATPNYPPSPYAPPPYPGAGAANCPACPAGTVCMNGACVPVYPQCPPGTLFDGMGNCVPVGYMPYPPPENSREVAKEAQAQAARERGRMRPKFTVDLQGSLGLMGEGSSPVVTPTFSVLLGTRLHMVPWFGLIFRGGPMVGIATYEETTRSGYSSGSSETDSTTMLGAMAEVIPFFGPMGRFYLGPSLSIIYLRFDSAGLTSNGSYVKLDSGATMAFGSQMGWVLGQEERTVLSFDLRIATLNGVTMFLTANVGFQI